jgi:hypothetical protein
MDLTGRSWILVTCTGAALLACVDQGAETGADLERRLEEASQVFHAGCDQIGACADPARVCGPDLETAIADAGASALAIEWEAEDTIVGIRTYYWFIEADGSGAFFHEARTDIAGSDCGSWCGWHREDYGSGELRDDAGDLHLAPGAPSNETEISDLDECGWP